MQAAVQSGGHSSRPLTGPASSQQLKSSSDIPQNSHAATGKGRKRERLDQNSDQSKRERSLKSDDNEAIFVKRDKYMKFDDVFSVVDKDGGVSTLTGVDRILYTMQHDKNDGIRKPSDVAARRTTLASIVAATEQEDCLNRFVQLGGLPLLDEWLQEAHKWKLDENGSPREGDKVLEDLLLTLLRALERLPVDLGSLKTCIVGKSVNTLRGHRNMEIQKRARKLVDLWKKRVDAEMKQSGESKLGLAQGMPWSGKQLLSDSNNALLPKGGGALEAPLKSSGVPESFARNAPSGSVSDEIPSSDLGHTSVGKAASSASSASPLGAKENQSKGVSNNSPDMPCSTSGQLIVNGAGWPNGQVKGLNSSWRDEGKSISSFPLHGKPNIPGSRSHGIFGKNVGAGHTTNLKEAGAGKPLVWSRDISTEKLGNGVSGFDKGLDGNTLEMPSNHRLIVRIPNRGRSPVRSGNGVPVPDLPAPSIRSSSPNISDRRGSSGAGDTSDTKSRIQTPVSSPEGNYGIDKEGVVSKTGESGDREGKQGGGCDSHKSEDCNQPEAQMAYSRLDTANVHLLTNHKDTGDVKLPETDAFAYGVPEDSPFRRSNSSGLDLATVGINLLASVAANESSISDRIVSVVVSDKTEPDNTTSEGNLLQGENAKAMKRSEKMEKMGNESTMSVKRDRCGEPHRLTSSVSSSPEMETKGCECDEKTGPDRPSTDCGSAVSAPLKGGIKVDHAPTPDVVIFTDEYGKTNLRGITISGDYYSVKDDVYDKKEGGTMTTIEMGEDLSRARENDAQKESEAVLRFTEEDALEVARQVAKEVEQEMESYRKNSSEREGADVTLVHDLKTSEDAESASVMEHSWKPLDRADDRVRNEELPNTHFSGPTPHLGSVCPNLNNKLNEKMVESLDMRESNQLLGKFGNMNSEEDNTSLKDEIKRANVNSLPSSVTQETSPSSLTTSYVVSPQQVLKPVPRNSQAGGTYMTEETSKFATLTDNAIKVRDAVERRDFDLNEGFVEEVSPQDTVSCYTSTKFFSGTSTGELAAPITVVAATKGPFIPPLSPLRSRGELGWKGSAATSAFRPAERRRTPERQPSVGDNLGPDVTLAPNVKQARPLLDFDLNVTDERVFDDVNTAITSAFQGISFGVGVPNSSITSSYIALSGDIGGTAKSCDTSETSLRPNLDLNRVDETEEGVMLPADFRVRRETGLQNSGKVFSTRGKNMMLNFDLNDGPSVEEVDETTSFPGCAMLSGGTTPSPLSGLRLSGEMVNVSQWSQARNLFPAVAIPTLASVKQEQPCPVATAPSFLSANPSKSASFLNAGPSASPFHCDIYRPGTSTFSSSVIAYPTQSPTAFPYAGFQFGFNAATFPAVSAPFMGSSLPSSFPAMPAQMLNTSAIMPSHIRPPYLMGVTDVTGTSCDSVWARPNLDLNAGPESVEADSKEDRDSARQSSVFGGIEDPRGFSYHVIEAGDAVKRKEPEGGWMLQRPMSKQPAWR